MADAAFGEGYEGVVFDEVHYARDWSLHVKSIYDNYPKKKIWICDSSSLVLEGDYANKIMAILEKSIFFDVPFFVPQVHENHLRLMNAMIGFLATSPIPTLNIDSLATEWSTGKEKLYQLLEVLEQIGIINIVRYAKDFRTSGKGAKIFLADPSMYFALAGDRGNVREAFVTTMFRQMGQAIFACKDERQGDFIVGKMTLEIGERNKSGKGADFVLRDDLDMPGKRLVPLWSLGMMY